MAKVKEPKAAKVKEPKAATVSADAGDLLDALGGDVKVAAKKKESDTPRITVTEPAVVAALKKYQDGKKKVAEAEQEVNAAKMVLDPVARRAHQDRSRLDKQTHKSVHIYDSATMNGTTYTLGRISAGANAEGVDKEGRSKVGPARAALKEVFGEADFNKYFAVSVALGLKEEACTAETVAMLKEKLGADVFASLFQSSPCIKILQISEKDKQQVLMRDLVQDDGVAQKVAAACAKQLLKRGYDALK